MEKFILYNVVGFVIGSLVFAFLYSRRIKRGWLLFLLCLVNIPHLSLLAAGGGYMFSLLSLLILFPLWIFGGGGFGLGAIVGVTFAWVRNGGIGIRRQFRRIPLGIVRRWLTIFAAINVIVFVGYGMFYPSLTLRYRLTLEAEVDGQPKTAASVVEVTYAKRPTTGRDLRISYRGEAVALDLGQRGFLFALLKEDGDPRSAPETIILRAFDFDGGIWTSDSVEQLQRKLRALSGKRELPLTSLPLLVRFRDINDPRSVEKVDPLNISNAFGVGVRLIGATLEIVPVGIWPLNLFDFTSMLTTSIVETQLPWLHDLKGGYLDGGAGGGPALSNILHSGYFKKVS